MYSEKVAKFCKIFHFLLTTVHTVKSKGKISKIFVAFSEYWVSLVRDADQDSLINSKLVAEMSH